MATTPDTQLNEETAVWRRAVEQAFDRPPGAWHECLPMVRRGVLLRRRWDRVAPASPQRQELLETLAAAQAVCQETLAGLIGENREPATELVAWVVKELDEDDEYLVGLLDDRDASPETIAFAVECFRDDLHWLGTQTALLDGARGIDFLGRILLEQEALQRAIDLWEDQAATGERTRPDDPGELRRAAEKLRATALRRRVEALLAAAEPEDWRGWMRGWRAASHVAMQILPPRDDGEAEPPDGATYRKLEEFRCRAADGWARGLNGLPADERRAAMARVANDLCDLTGESLTFVEDLPLDRAVRSLEILSDDLTRCMKVVRQHWSRAMRGEWRSMRRRKRRVEAELQERRLAWRMERLFGHRAVTFWERSILALLLAFMGMLALEIGVVERQGLRPEDVSAVLEILAWADLGICVVFLTDFFLRMALVRRRWFYFRRNWITGFLPAIPFGFISMHAIHATAHLAEAGEGFVLLRALRYLRLPRMARWLRIARPAMRLFRLLAFALRASDRMMRQLGPLINRNLVLFERAAIEEEEPRYRRAIAALRERFNYRATEVFALLPEAARWSLIEARIDDLAAMLAAPRGSLTAPPPTERGRVGREIPLDRMVGWLLTATPAGISDRIGRRLARSVARWCQAFDLIGIRRLPLARDLAAAGRLPSPYETTARVANRIGAMLKGLMDRIYWLADLYGTVTAPQLVDSIGETMIKGSARPARRLLMIGAAFLLLSYLTGLMPFDTLKMATEQLRRLIGTPLVVLGILCLIPLFLGMWFRRIAGEATDFYGQVAEAQFMAASKQFKQRRSPQQHATLFRRAIAPEMELAGDAGPAADGQRCADDEAEDARAAVELLWNDYLDGAPFHHGDTKTTTQLLGNLALISLRRTRMPWGRRERKRLARLDLTHAHSSLRGPYLWFHFICRSLAQQTAKLVVDYNAHALPIRRLDSADDALVIRYLRWLGKRSGKPLSEIAPAALVGRADLVRRAEQASKTDGRDVRREGFQGNDFTAIHFFSTDPAIDEEVRRRYGEQVLELMRMDRRDNIRRVFRTYPFHRWPKERRTINLMTLYERHLAGGRVLLLPFKLLGWTLWLSFLAVGHVWRIVREVLSPTMRRNDAAREDDPQAVAVRKIHRMRGPTFMACLRLRAEVDPEYLGVLLPGRAAARGSAVSPIEEDLVRIGAEPGDCVEFRELAARRHGQVLELRRWLARFDLRRLSARSLRAVTMAYTLDYRGVRGVLEAARELDRAFDEAVADPAAARRAAGAVWRPRALSCRLRYRGRVRRLFEQTGFDRRDPAQRRICRRVLYGRRGPLLAALRTLTPAGADPVDDARKLLEGIGRDAATWTRQMVVLRAVQTLSVLDLETYRELAAELGGYETATASTET